MLYDCVKYFHYTRRVTSKHGVRSKSDCQLFVSTVFFSNHAVKPPQLFNIREPQGWPEWRSQFQRFQTASELPDKSGEVQVSSLIYSMGLEATVPSSPRQSSVLLQIGGISAMSLAAPTTHKAMVLRSEW